MADTPSIAENSSQRGFLPPGPGLFRLTFDMQSNGLDEGYLGGPYPRDGQPLDDFCQQYISGITCLDPTYVRPLWQPEPPNIPDFWTNWVAVGITESELDPGWAYRLHDPAHGGRSIVKQHEIFSLLCAFYGPEADWYDGLLRDGLSVPQNSEVLQLNAMGLVDWHHRVVVPEMIKNKWWRRVDRHVRIHREIRRTYPILNILSASVSVTVETQGETTIHEDVLVTPPGIT